MGLTDLVQYTSGVGPRVAATLEKLGIKTVKDLIYHFPRRYEDRGNFVPIFNLKHNEPATIKGVIQAVENKKTSKKNFIITNAILTNDTGSIRLTWFNQPYKRTEFEKLIGQEIIVYGNIIYDGWNYNINTPEYEKIKDEQLKTGRIVPIYPLTDGITQDYIRKIIHSVVKNNIDEIKEDLPKDILLECNLIDKKQAIFNIHFPESIEIFEAARKRLVFDELFILQMGLAIKRREFAMPGTGIKFNIPENYNKELKQIIPFELTNAQKKVIKEIINDMTKGECMNRLLQGDVGSGKTVVALAAMLFAVRNGYQAAIMAPTEILAEQHYISLSEMLSSLGVLDINIDLLKGNLRVKQKRDVTDRINSGATNIIIGTHALLSESVDFHRLGLVIIDEQHRFGVLQRATLKEKGLNPDILVMTATPIPRTLTLVVYGDLSVSVLDEMPKGRKPVKTHWKTTEERERVYSALKNLIKKGYQAYIVCPLIEESEKLQALAATELFETLKNEEFPEFNIGLLHGQMKTNEKDIVMQEFRSGNINILVSTTVIEVGVDVPNANCIIIEDADRFGLSQLHQLRGRVGRGDDQGFCILISDAKTEDSKKRMEIMESTSNGFIIAEEDLILRGPGEFSGTRQSGFADFKIADIFKDTAILESARTIANKIIDKDPTLRDIKYKEIKKELLLQKDKFDLISIS